jgi:hypothetical protein
MGKPTMFLWNLIARIALEGITVTPDLDTVRGLYIGSTVPSPLICLSL